MESPQLIQELVKSFNALADEVQNLTDRKTILEHKLRYAHEQVCYRCRYSTLLYVTLLLYGLAHFFFTRCQQVYVMNT